MSRWGVYPYRCGACEARFHARHREAETPEAVSSELKRIRRRKPKGWVARLKELTDIRKEKRTRIATQALIYGLALLTFVAIIYALIQFG